MIPADLTPSVWAAVCKLPWTCRSFNNSELGRVFGIFNKDKNISKHCIS